MNDHVAEPFRGIVNSIGRGPTEEEQIASVRADMRAALEWIEQLTELVRDVANAEVLETRDGETVISGRFSCYAEELVCCVKGCCKRPTGDTPNGRYFCAEHAK